MARTLVSVQGTILAPDGSPARGTLCATPDWPLDVGSGLFPASPVCGLLDAAGMIRANSYHALALYATDESGDDEAGTTQVGAVYRWLLQIDGQTVTEFGAPLPVASTATETNGSTNGTNLVTLSTLLASAAMVGHSITGTNISGGTTVTAYDDKANTLTLSAVATGTGSGLSFVVGGAVELEALQMAATS
jgi:hypothetical protein